MNERIKELAFEANKDLDGAVPLVFAETFAELIVRECARVDSEANNPYHIDGETCNQTILEHFGIEQ